MLLGGQMKSWIFAVWFRNQEMAPQDKNGVVNEFQEKI